MQIYKQNGVYVLTRKSITLRIPACDKITEVAGSRKAAKIYQERFLSSMRSKAEKNIGKKRQGTKKLAAGETILLDDAFQRFLEKLHLRVSQ